MQIRAGRWHAAFKVSMHKFCWRCATAASRKETVCYVGLRFEGFSVKLRTDCTRAQMNVFCGRCGGATEAIEAGAKRQCSQDSKHRVYPRTDPVVRNTCSSAIG